MAALVTQNIAFWKLAQILTRTSPSPRLRRRYQSCSDLGRCRYMSCINRLGGIPAPMVGKGSANRAP